MMTGWKQLLDPVIANPIVSGVAINGVVLKANVVKQIPTTLNRMQQGWFVTDNVANCNVWRTSPFNKTVLSLESSADVIINLWVY
jgi:hypothetical protein